MFIAREKLIFITSVSVFNKVPNSPLTPEKINLLFHVSNISERTDRKHLGATDWINHSSQMVATAEVLRFVQLYKLYKS